MRFQFRNGKALTFKITTSDEKELCSFNSVMVRLLLLFSKFRNQTPSCLFQFRNGKALTTVNPLFS